MAAATALPPSAMRLPFSVGRTVFSLSSNNRFNPVSCKNRGFVDSDEHYYCRNSLIFWDKFYKRHENKFFKDRHYLEKDWGKYFSVDDDGVSADGKVLLEVGFGAGNTIFPLIAAYPMLFVHACDFSTEALNLVKSHSNFDGNRMNVFTCDVTSEDLCNEVLASSVDLVTLIFMLSAVSPKKMPFVIQNLKKILKPNGHVLVRDYAVGDSAQALDTCHFQEGRQLDSLPQFDHFNPSLTSRVMLCFALMDGSKLMMGSEYFQNFFILSLENLRNLKLRIFLFIGK